MLQKIDENGLLRTKPNLVKVRILPGVMKDFLKMT